MRNSGRVGPHGRQAAATKNMAMVCRRPAVFAASSAWWWPSVTPGLGQVHRNTVMAGRSALGCRRGISPGYSSWRAWPGGPARGRRGVKIRGEPVEITRQRRKSRRGARFDSGPWSSVWHSPSQCTKIDLLRVEGDQRAPVLLVGPYTPCDAPPFDPSHPSRAPAGLARHAALGDHGAGAICNSVGAGPGSKGIQRSVCVCGSSKTCSREEISLSPRNGNPVLRTLLAEARAHRAREIGDEHRAGLPEHGMSIVAMGQPRRQHVDRRSWQGVAAGCRRVSR